MNAINLNLYIPAYRLVGGIYLVSHTCTLAVTSVSVWAKERDYPQNICVTGKHLCQTSCFKFFWGVWKTQRLIWAWVPLACVTSALAVEFPFCVSAFVLYLSRWGLLQNANFFCFSAPLPPFQLVLVPASLQFLLLTAISFNGPIQLCLCMREILLVTGVVAELGPEHLLELMQLPQLQLWFSRTVIDLQMNTNFSWNLMQSFLAY